MMAARWILGGLVALALAPAPAWGDDQITWQPSLEVARKLAAQSNRLVLVHFWSTSCKPCVRLEKEVLSRPEVARALSAHFVMVKLNVDESLGTARVYGVSSVPADVVISPSGQLISQQLSPPTANQYIAQLTRVAAGYRELTGQGSRQANAQPPVSQPVSQVPPQAPIAPPAQVVVQQEAPAMQSPMASVQPSTVVQTPAQVAPPSDPVVQNYTTVVDRATPAGPASQSVYENDRYAEYYRRRNLTPPSSAVGPSDTAPSASPAVVAPTEAPVEAQSVAASAPANDGAYRSPAVEAQQQRQQIEQLRQSEPIQSGSTPAAVAVTVQPAAPLATDPAGPPAQDASGPAVVVASPAQPPAAQAGSPQIPPGSPPVALDGFCPVTLVERRAWSPGNVAYGVVHRGRTYLFAGPEQVQKFLANPDAYAPVLSGNDPVLALDNQVSVPGRREYGVFSGSRVYLFANEESRNRFQQNPNRYAAEVVQAMR